MKTFRRTCQWVVAPGLRETMPVSKFAPWAFQRLVLKGSAKLYWCSMATNFCVGGEVFWMVLIFGERSSMATPYFAAGSMTLTVAAESFQSILLQLSS